MTLVSMILEKRKKWMIIISNDNEWIFFVHLTTNIMSTDIKEKMRKMVGNHSHKDCKYSGCPSRKKQQKSEHIFVEKSVFLGCKWGWECMACGMFTKVASV